MPKVLDIFKNVLVFCSKKTKMGYAALESIMERLVLVLARSCPSCLNIHHHIAEPQYRLSRIPYLGTNPRAAAETQPKFKIQSATL